MIQVNWTVLSNDLTLSISAWNILYEQMTFMVGRTFLHEKSLCDKDTQGPIVEFTKSIHIQNRLILVFLVFLLDN